MPDPRSEFIAGVKALLPILLGVVPFGLISGITVIQTHIPPVSGFIMSLLVFSGAALIVALQLITTGAPALVIFFSALVINLRFMIYSASLAPYFNRLSIGRKGLLAYLISDQGLCSFDQPYQRESLSGSDLAALSGIGYHHVGGMADKRWNWHIRGRPAACQLVAGVHHPPDFSGIGGTDNQRSVHWHGGVNRRVVAVLAYGAPFKTGLVIASWPEFWRE